LIFIASSYCQLLGASYLAADFKFLIHSIATISRIANEKIITDNSIPDSRRYFWI